MCVEERWYFHQLVLMNNCWIYYHTQTLIEYGLSSNQTRTNDIRNVVLLVVDPSSIHHYIFWV